MGSNRPGPVRYLDDDEKKQLEQMGDAGAVLVQQTGKLDGAQQLDLVLMVTAREIRSLHGSGRILSDREIARLARVTEVIATVYRALKQAPKEADRGPKVDLT